MDYKKIYNQIVERAKNRELKGYKEKHHIIPKCLGGSDEEDNLVELTAREHFLCHMLLCEIYPKKVKLTQALWLMAIGKRKNKDNEFKINSRIYERLRIEFSKKMKGTPKPPGTGKKISESNMGKKHTQVTKDKMSISKQNMSYETKNKISKSNTGLKRSDETKFKMSKIHKGKKITQETKDKMSLAKKGKLNPKVGEKRQGTKLSQETKDKISLAKKGKILTQEHKNKISKSNKGKSKHTLESKETLRKSKLGTKLSQETKDKIYTDERNNKISKSNKGKKRTQETKDKMSLAKKGKPSLFSKPIIQYNLGNEYIKEWPSITEAKKWLGVGDIQSCLLGKQRTAGGFIWKYKN